MDRRTQESGGSRAVRKLAELRLDFGGVCSWGTCTETENLQFAHIIKTQLQGMGRGSYTRLKDIREHPASYRLWCIFHHKEFDTRAGLDLIIL